MKINEKLKTLRQSKNLTQNEAAKLLEISLSSYQKYEREKNSITPSLEALIKLANFYHVTTDYLLGRNDNDNHSSSKNLVDETIKELEKLPPKYREIFLDLLKKMVEAENTN